MRKNKSAVVNDTKQPSSTVEGDMLLWTNDTKESTSTIKKFELQYNETVVYQPTFLNKILIIVIINNLIVIALCY